MEATLYPFGGKMLEIDEIREKAFDMLAHPDHPKGCEVPPEALLGFRVGDHINFEEYTKAGFTHPKNPVYYQLKHNDPDFKRIYDGIKESGTIDNPIVVYPYEHEGKKHLVVIDGATRMSVVGYLRAENSKVFLRVQCTPTPPLTNPDEAQAMMVRLNMEGRGRMLSPYEILESVHRCRSAQRWEHKEIVKYFGLTSQAAHTYLKLHMDLIQPMRMLWRDGHINFDQVKEFSKLSREDQIKEATKIEKRIADKAKKVAPHAAELREKRREQKRLMNPMKRVRQFENGLTILRDSYKNQPEVEAKLKGYLDTIEKSVKHVKSVLEKELGISCEAEEAKGQGLGKSLKKLAKMAAAK